MHVPPSDSQEGTYALTDCQCSRILQVGDSEILLCDSTEFAARALNAGASSVQVLVYRGMWHCWPMYSQLAKDACKEPLAEAQWALEDLSRFLSKLDS